MWCGYDEFTLHLLLHTTFWSFDFGQKTWLKRETSPHQKLRCMMLWIRNINIKVFCDIDGVAVVSYCKNHMKKNVIHKSWTVKIEYQLVAQSVSLEEFLLLLHFYQVLNRIPVKHYQTIAPIKHVGFQIFQMLLLNVQYSLKITCLNT